MAKSLEAGRDYGPLTTETQRAIVRRHLASAKAGGAKLLAGSFGDEGEGGGVAEAAKGAAPIAPTVLEVTTDELAVMC